MTRTIVALATFALLSSGCVRTTAVLPDPSIPHWVAKEETVEVWARKADGTLVRVKVRVLPGWWVASPEVVE